MEEKTMQMYPEFSNFFPVQNLSILIFYLFLKC